MGLYLSGHDPMLAAHRIGAMVTAVLVLLQLVVAVLYVVRAKGRRTPAIFAASMLVVVIVQMIAGFKHYMGLHVPLGVMLFGGAARLLGWVGTVGNTTPAQRETASEQEMSA
jgi:heme A synthase